MSSKPHSPRDSLFAQPLGNVAEFTFDDRVASVFPDMLKRSIPGYQAIISQSGLLAAQFAQPNTHLYDLGCSLGATSLSMQKAMLAEKNSFNEDETALPNKPYAGCEIHAIDTSQAMLDRARDIIEGETSPGSAQLPIVLRCADARTTPLHNASVVAMNFTMQFIEPDNREQLIERIASSLVSGGAFILSEKVTFTDPVLSDLHIKMYHSFKSANGYSDLEISQKRTALENVLVPDTLDTHLLRLRQAGFKRCSVWFQCFNFASIVAIK